MHGTVITSNWVDFGDFNGTNFTKNGICAISYDSTNPPTRVDRPQYEAIVRRCLPVRAGTITDAWNSNYEQLGGFWGLQWHELYQKMAVVPYLTTPPTPQPVLIDTNMTL